MAGVVDRIPDKAGIQHQIMLPWSKAFQMTRENIFVRFGRSVITASGIFLGTAFMSAVFFGGAAAAVKANLDLRQGITPQAAEMQARTIWLVTMSLVVATVGIVNSMLMSVTERYKEIGTMKCLGALDRFIVRLFILEALLLGVLGSVGGAVIGTAAMTIMWIGRIGAKNTLVAWVTPAVQLGGKPIQLWVCVVIGVLIGGILSALAALYPAWRAAKMPPAAALRSEF